MHADEQADGRGRRRRVADGAYDDDDDTLKGRTRKSNDSNRPSVPLRGARGGAPAGRVNIYESAQNRFDAQRSRSGKGN